MRVHLIRSEMMVGLGASSKLNAEWAFLCMLRDEGRPVARLDRLSTYRDLIARAAELHRAGQGYAAIAQTLNREGWRPAKRRETFTASMVRHLLCRAGLAMPKYQRPPIAVERGADEWTIAELARHISVPESTLYTWVQKGRLRCRTVRVGGCQLRLVQADDDTVARLRTVRATPAPWRRLPPPVAAAPGPAKSSTGES